MSSPLKRFEAKPSIYPVDSHVTSATTMFTDPKGIPRTAAEMDWAIEEDYVIPAFRKNELSVDLLLDYVDLSLDWYIPSEDAFKFISFIRLCIGAEPENLNSLAHYFFADCLFGSVEVKPYFDVRGMDFEELAGDTLILSSREFSKTVLTIYFILYMASTGQKPNFGKVNYGMYVSDRMEGNVKTTMQTIESLVMGSEYLRNIFEEYHMTDKEVWFVRKPQSIKEVKVYNAAIARGAKPSEVPMRAERTFRLAGLGCSGGRGSRSGLDRPQFAIFDDMIANEKDAFSKAILESIDSTIEADVGSSLSGNKHFKVYIGTAYHLGDPVCKRVVEGAALSVVFPKAEQAPHGDILDKDGNVVTPALKEEDFISVWEDRHSFKKQRAAYAKAEKALLKGNPKPLKTINQEFYVRVTSEHERLIPDSYIKWANVEEKWEHADCFTWYITTDYTTTGNVSSDDSSAGLWACDNEGNDFLMAVALRKMGLDEQYSNTMAMIERALDAGASFVQLGVEIDGQQSLHIIALESYFEKRGKSELLDFAVQRERDGKKVTWAGIRSKGSGDKLWRLKVRANDFYNGTVYFNEKLDDPANLDMDTLRRELRNVSFLEIKSTDNGLDMLSQKSLIDWDYAPVSLQEHLRVSTDEEDTRYNETYDDVYEITY